MGFPMKYGKVGIVSDSRRLTDNNLTLVIHVSRTTAVFAAHRTRATVRTLSLPVYLGSCVITRHAWRVCLRANVLASFQLELGAL